MIPDPHPELERPRKSPALPRHVAIIMDGNGRWARRRHLPRIAGHRAGVEAVRRTVRLCGEKGLEVLTLFAFSSENWRRPKEEVGMLMGLFLNALEQEAGRLHEHNVRLRVVGDRAPFAPELRTRIFETEEMTRHNAGLELVIAANYGGRWDVTQAAQLLARRVQSGELKPEQITTEVLASQLSLAELPEPDLFIRTGGERRVSNFLLWHLAYTELYFTDTLWPDFDGTAFESALASFASRQRRFGRTGDQVAQAQGY